MNRLLLFVICLSVPAPLFGQGRTRITIGAGPYRVDELARTPLVPMIGVLKPRGQRGLVGANLGLVRSAGFYDLNALTLDVHIGIRSAPAHIEWHATAGPSGMLGGDSDGTPYLQLGGQGTVGATWWFANRLGAMAAATGRAWLTTANSRFSPSAYGGMVIGR